MSDMRQMTDLGRRIENDSFAIIDEETGDHHHPPGDWEVVRRVIHATADFEFKDLMALHPEAVDAGIRALVGGCPVIVDVRMIESGLNKARLDHYGCQIHCFISDDEVIAQAKKENSTRAIVAMRKARDLGLLDGAVVAVGNAPTALIELARMAKAGEAKPALVVGVPVGFVSAAESKEEAIDSTLPYIVARGRKGGSPIAVAILHALLLLSTRSEQA